MRHRELETVGWGEWAYPASNPTAAKHFAAAPASRYTLHVAERQPSPFFARCRLCIALESEAFFECPPKHGRLGLVLVLLRFLVDSGGPGPIWQTAACQSWSQENRRWSESAL